LPLAAVLSRIRNDAAAVLLLQHLLMRYDVAKCWVSEQEGVRAHARVIFVDELFIPNVRAFFFLI